MLQCKIVDGLTVSKSSNTTEATMACVGRAARPWKILHFGMVNRVSLLVKNALGYMTMPGNYCLQQTETTCAYARIVNQQKAFMLARQDWPDFICVDVPNTFGFIERYFTNESWNRLLSSLGKVPIFTFDMQDLGNYSSMPNEHPLFKRETLRFKREPWDEIENYPVEAKNPISVWLGASCSIHKSIPWNKRNWDIFFWCNDTSELRVEVITAFKKSEFWDNPRCVFYLENKDLNPAAKNLLTEYGYGRITGFATPSIPYETFGRIVADSKVLCAPDGYGQFTHRHVEGLLSGSAVITSPSLIGAHVPMKNCFRVAETAENWPVLAYKILYEDDAENTENRLILAQEEALNWYSTPGFAKHLGAVIEDRLIKSLDIKTNSMHYGIKVEDLNCV